MRRQETALGLLALAFYVVHAAEVLLTCPPEALLWSCNVASAIVAASLLAGLPLGNAVGGSMLVVGNPLWVIEILTGGQYLQTSPLTHVGILAISLVGMKRLGLPRATWWAAPATILALLVVSRLATSPASIENVNLVHRIPPGWERPFPSHGAYLAFVGGCMAAGAVALHALLRAVGFGAGPSTTLPD